VDTLDDVQLKAEQIEKLYETLEDLNVDVIDDEIEQEVSPKSEDEPEQEYDLSMPRA
jgi:RNA polymerase primary sigma factor